MPLMEHLVELRARLIKMVVAVLLGAIVGFIAYPWIFDFLIGPYEELCETAANTLDDQCRLLLTDPLGGFSVRMKVSVYGGIALAMPVLLWQVWRFVAPGLYPRGAALRHPVRPQRPACSSPWARASPTGPCPRRCSSSSEIAGEDNVVVGLLAGASTSSSSST